MRKFSRCFTPEQIKKATELASQGCTVKVICDSIGICEAVYYKLKAEYQKEDSTYEFTESEKEFVEKVTAGINESFVAMETCVFGGCLTNPNLALETLSRRRARDWGRKDYQKIDANVKSSNTHNIDYSNLTEDEAKELFKKKQEEMKNEK
jgi:hypothetical protein